MAAWTRRPDPRTGQVSWTSGPYRVVRRAAGYVLTCDGVRVRSDPFGTLADAKEAAVEDDVDKADAAAEAVLKEQQR